MAAKAFILNPNVKQVAVMWDKTSQQPQSFGHVSLPKNTSIHTSNQSIIASSSSVMAPPIISTTTSTNTTTTTSREVTCPDSTRAVNIPLSGVWRDIQGCNNWENLVQPLNPLLKHEITRYGNLVTACYKAFDLDPSSKRYLNCKYGKKTLLKEAGIDNPDDYQVTKYIYAVPDISINININPIQNQTNRGRWVGYVAVSSDESVKRLGRRDIVVTFRGTVTNPEWIANFMSSLTPARLDPHDERPDVKVESGFLSLYTSDENQSKFGLESCRQQLLSEISRLINKYKDEEMSITLAGHSMGSSLAHLLAYDISELGINRGVSPAAGDNDNNKNNQNNVIPVTVFSFAGPRVGNLGFKERCEELGVKVLRIVNVNDPITKLPGVVFNENFGFLGRRFELPWSCSCYAHVGVELALDFFNVQNPTCVHDLETYINLLNRPRSASKSTSQSQSQSLLTNDADRGEGDLTVEFLNRASQMMFSKNNSVKWKIAAYSVVNLLGSVSNHLMYCNIF